MPRRDYARGNEEHPGHAHDDTMCDDRARFIGDAHEVVMNPDRWTIEEYNNSDINLRGHPW